MPPSATLKTPLTPSHTRLLTLDQISALRVNEGRTLVNLTKLKCPYENTVWEGKGYYGMVYYGILYYGILYYGMVVFVYALCGRKASV